MKHSILVHCLVKEVHKNPASLKTTCEFLYFVQMKVSKNISFRIMAMIGNDIQNNTTKLMYVDYTECSPLSAETGFKLQCTQTIGPYPLSTRHQIINAKHIKLYYCTAGTIL